jgi:SAM-dependent methyltransferase
MKHAANAMNAVAEFYRANPRMVSSPFGGVDGIRSDLLSEVWTQLDIDSANKRVLDIGCGRGFVEDLVRERGGRYTGADFVVSRRGFPLVQADSAALPFADASFDLALCVDAFEHFPNPDRAAREIRRVLRPGGVFFLSAPNYGNVAGVVKRVYEGLGWYAPKTWAPFGRWQPQEFELPLTGGFVRRVFTRAGFRAMRRIGHGAEVGLGLFPWIDHPRMPEAIQFRLQWLFARIGPPIAAAAPTLSLHNFWRMDA